MNAGTTADGATLAPSAFCSRELHAGKVALADWLVTAAYRHTDGSAVDLSAGDGSTFASCGEHLPDAIAWLRAHGAGGATFVLRRVNEARR
jgi:hypothetical protein